MSCDDGDFFPLLPLFLCLSKVLDLPITRNLLTPLLPLRPLRPLRWKTGFRCRRLDFWRSV